jgi:hypothetical protein
MGFIYIRRPFRSIDQWMEGFGAEATDARWAARKEILMRMILALPLLMVAACDVKKDVANDQTTYELNEQRIEKAAEGAGNAVEAAANDVGKSAKSAGEKVKKQVDDVHVKVDVDHNKK